MNAPKLLPKHVDAVTLAFPANVVGVYLPKLEEIPDKYKTNEYSWKGGCELATRIFSNECSGKKVGFVPMPGVDPQGVWEHLSVCLGSYQPKHEHKIAGTGWLIEMWICRFLLDDEVVWTNPNIEEDQEGESK